MPRSAVSINIESLTRRDWTLADAAAGGVDVCGLDYEDRLHTEHTESMGGT